MPKIDDKVMRALRVRARRSVQTIFATLAIFTLSMALYIHHTPGFADLGHTDANALANAFLFLGTANALTMWVWDWLFWNDLEV